MHFLKIYFYTTKIYHATKIVIIVRYHLFWFNWTILKALWNFLMRYNNSLEQHPNSRQLFAVISIDAPITLPSWLSHGQNYCLIKFILIKCLKFACLKIKWNDGFNSRGRIALIRVHGSEMGSFVCLPKMT